MGYLGRRIGISQSKAGPSSSDGTGGTGGGILDLFSQGYFNREGNIYNNPDPLPFSFTNPQGLTATGGIINDYAYPDGNVYRAHIFLSTGRFDVSATSSTVPNVVDFLIMAGGGGGGVDAYSGPRGAGGGGAGGIHSSHPDMPSPRRSTALTATVNNYPVTVGAGGGGATAGGGSAGQGSPSVFNSITSTGGGGGGGHDDSSGQPAPAGGSTGGSTNGRSVASVVAIKSRFPRWCWI